jgi:tetratricopeptide (TPR) repeat protein
MAVLVEALSVIVRRESVNKLFKGGWQEFLHQVPNGTLCYDQDLARIGFMKPVDVEAYISSLEAGGLVFQNDEQAIDFTVVDQIMGSTIPTSWLELHRVVLFKENINILVCCLSGHDMGKIAVPDNWEYGDSISAKPGFIPNNLIDDKVKFLRREKGLDVYMDLRSGQELFMGRPIIKGTSAPALFTQLEAIFHEVWSIEEQIQSLNTEDELAPLFYRLNDELLPVVQEIINGNGQQMAFAYFNVGTIFRLLKRPIEAEGAFRKANELQPRKINTLNELVRCLGEQNKHVEALSFAREAVKAEPINEGAWGNLAMCLIMCGERDEARKVIDYAVELEPQNKKNSYIRDNFDRYFQ